MNSPAIATVAPGFDVIAYDASMRKGVVDLLCEEYGGDHATRSEHFAKFYEHPFQRDHAIRIAAVDGSKVVGFETAFRWPYEREGEQLVTLQSGNSIIAKTWRGQGVFGRLLHHLDKAMDPDKVDALVGFPVDASLRSFMRAGWTHLGDLAWSARPISPASLFSQIEPAAVMARFDTKPEPVAARQRTGFELTSNPDFLAWRAQFRDPAHYAYFHHRSGGKTVRFDLKLETRGRAKLLMIGAVAADDADPWLMRRAIADLIKATRGTGAVTCLAVALNRDAVSDPLAPHLSRNLFVPLHQKVYFIAKRVRDRGAEFLDWRLWRLYRGDVDTW